MVDGSSPYRSLDGRRSGFLCCGGDRFDPWRRVGGIAATVPQVRIGAQLTAIAHYPR